MFDAGIPCGPEANMAKHLASEAAIEAGNACIDCHGGYGFAEEYDIERKFREIAPLPRGAHQQQPRHGLRRGARPRHAALLLGR